MQQPTRIGFNLLFLVPGETGGMEIYARELLRALTELGRFELVAFTNSEGAELGIEGVRVVPVGVTGRSRFARIAAEELRLPRLAKAYDIDLLHSLGSSAPGRPGVRSVITIHDVIYASYPEAHTKLMLAGMRAVVPRAARSADRVITISKHSAGEIEAQLGVPASRIDVTYQAGRAPGSPTAPAEVRRRYGLGEAPVVLSASARRPTKNLPRLLEAFSRVPGDSVLVLPGYKTTFEDGISRSARELGVADRVRFLGWVSDADLDGLYAIATCSVFPSLAEGFGLPVLESMQRGVPVACSNTTSLPEVGGDAALYFDPLDEGAISQALRRLLEDQGLRERHAATGIEQAKRFSWKATAEATAASYGRAWRSRP